jgi:hypothetical protein
VHAHSLVEYEFRKPFKGFFRVWLSFPTPVCEFRSIDASYSYVELHI